MMRRLFICLTVLWSVWLSILLAAVVMEHSAQRAESIREILMLIVGSWLACGVLCGLWGFLIGSPSRKGNQSS
jgi:hypothetical protein